MARYQDNKYLTHQSSDAFDKEHRPSDSAHLRGFIGVWAAAEKSGLRITTSFPLRITMSTPLSRALFAGV